MWPQIVSFIERLFLLCPIFGGSTDLIRTPLYKRHLASFWFTHTYKWDWVITSLPRKRWWRTAIRLSWVQSWPWQRCLLLQVSVQSSRPWTCGHRRWTFHPFRFHEWNLHPDEEKEREEGMKDRDGKEHPKILHTWHMNSGMMRWKMDPL